MKLLSVYWVTIPAQLNKQLNVGNELKEIRR